jgi:hypothetical protein
MFASHWLASERTPKRYARGPGIARSMDFEPLIGKSLDDPLRSPSGSYFRTICALVPPTTAGVAEACPLSES